MVKKSARRTRRTHSPAFKAQVALSALREDKMMAELCKEFELHASQVIEWKRQLLEGAALRPVYTAASAEAAEQALNDFELGAWGFLTPPTRSPTTSLIRCTFSMASRIFLMCVLKQTLSLPSSRNGFKCPKAVKPASIFTRHSASTFSMELS
jgi:hypothetical protein